MIGRLARGALFLELLAYLCWGLWLHAGLVPLWRIFAMVMAAALLLRFVITLVPFLTVMALRLRDGRKILGVGFARAIWGEFMAKSLSFTLWQPFERCLMPPDPVPSPGGPAPVLLVHGYLCNRGSWHVMRRLLGQRLPNAIHTISLEPPFTRIDDYVLQLEARVTQILAGTGHARLHLVCHSMGGLVARAWLARSGGWSRVASVCMLGSPHHGTELARAGIGHNVRQMVKGNGWLAKLDSEETGLAPAVPVISLHTENDNLIYPPESSDLPWAANIRIEGVGHVQLQSSAEVALRIVANLREAALE